MPRYTCRRIGNIYPHKNLYTNAHSNITYNSQENENQHWKNKSILIQQNIIQPYKGMKC